MNNIDNLKRQHVDLLDLQKRINNQLSIDTIKVDLNEIIVLISSFVGKLKIHLISEDKNLYPNLLKSKDNNILTLAKEFIAEMGELSHEVELYQMKWHKISDVNEKPLLFIEDTRRVISNVCNRIAKEEFLLFPKVEIKSEVTN